MKKEYKYIVAIIDEIDNIIDIIYFYSEKIAAAYAAQINKTGGQYAAVVRSCKEIDQRGYII